MITLKLVTNETTVVSNNLHFDVKKYIRPRDLPSIKRNSSFSAGMRQKRDVMRDIINSLDLIIVDVR